MKKLIKTSILFAIMAVIITPVFANNSCLTEEQKLLLSSNIRESTENFEAFRSTLNVFQLAILEDQDLNRFEKHQEFKASLTIEQEALLEAHKIFERLMKEEFENSLTADQKKDLKNTIGNSLDREELAILEARKVLREAMRNDSKLRREHS